MFNDEALAYCELSNDLLFGKIHKSEMLNYVTSALTAGRIAAESALEQSDDIFELYRRADIVIERIPKASTTFGVAFRAQAVLGDGVQKVEIYDESIAALAQYSGLKGLTELDVEKALRLHLAHEYFHFLEHQSGKTVAERLTPVTLMKLGRWQRKAHIQKCSEIAAHAFAKTYLKLTALPNAYDYAYLIGTGKMQPEAFDALIQEASNALT